MTCALCSALVQARLAPGGISAMKAADRLRRVAREIEQTGEITAAHKATISAAADLITMLGHEVVRLSGGPK